MYHGKPSGVPVNASTRHHLFSDDFCALAANRSAAEEPQPQHSVSDIIDPYPNKSTFLFNDWFWTGANKSQRSRKDLLENVLRHPDFVLKDLPKTDAELRRLDQALAENPGSVASSSGWKVTDVDIMIPTGKKSTKTSRQQAAAARQRQRHVLPICLLTRNRQQSLRVYSPSGASTISLLRASSLRLSRLLKQLTSTGIRLKSAGKDHGIKNALNESTVIYADQGHFKMLTESCKPRPQKVAASCLALLLLLCSTPMLHMSHNLGKQNSGPSIQCLAISRSMTEANLACVAHTQPPFCHQYVLIHCLCMS